MRHRKSSGFTLIELVVVITIIGILAAFALPKYASMQAEARVSKMNGAYGAIKAAAALAHAQLLTRGYSATYTNAASPFNIEDVQVKFTNGYPTSDTITLLASLSGSDFNIQAPTGSPSSIAINADTQHTSCTISYTEAAAPVAPATSSVPTYDNSLVTLANCQ